MMTFKPAVCGLFIVVLTCRFLPAQDEWDDINRFDPCEALEDGALFKPLGEISTEIQRDDQRLPPDCSGPYFQTRTVGGGRRIDTVSSFCWEPTNFFHKPVYFDNVPLERYGQSTHPHWEPLISGAKFALTLPVLPYKMGLDRPWACITTLGHLPPGDCVPCIKQTLPLQADAAFWEAAATVGLAFALP